MKRIGKILGMLALGLVFLGACGGSQTEVNTFSGSYSGADVTVKVTHEDQTVNQVEMVSSFDLTTLGLDTADLDETQQAAIEDELAAQYEEYDGSEGVTIENDFTDNVFSVTITLDLENVDPTVFNDLTGTTADTGDVAYDELAAQLEDLGLSEE